MPPGLAQDLALWAFAERHGFASGPGGGLPVCGTLGGVALTVGKVNRGQMTSPCWCVQLVATAPYPIPGGLVAYKPNFLVRLPGPRTIQDAQGASGLLGFAHHDRMGDRELDKKLVVFADDVASARALLTTPEVKRAILAALAAAGHIRIHESRVVLEVPERRGGVLRPLASAEEVEALGRAATDVARAISAAGGFRPGP